MSHSIQSLKIQNFLQQSHYNYSSDQSLNVPAILAEDYWAALEDKGIMTAFLSLYSEERPSTLPSSVPDRIYVRALGIAHRYSPTAQLALLLHSLLAKLDEEYETKQSAFQIICYGSEPWLVRALLSAGFEIVERIQYFQLERLGGMAMEPPKKMSTLTIFHEGVRKFFGIDSPCDPALEGSIHEEAIDSLCQEQSPDFTTLAQLDSETFEPLWHFGESELRSLWSHSWSHTVYLNDTLVGYAIMVGASLSDTDPDEPKIPYLQPAHTTAQLVRLAVHPSAQGQGIGRQLLSVTLMDAHSRGIRAVTLNTQTTNESSKRLYRSFGFRPQGGTIPVLVKRG